MCILEAYHSTDEERITLRQLALKCQEPGESVGGYINRWQLTHRCEDPPIQGMWIRLCLHSLHDDFKMLTIREDFRNFEELIMFMETITSRVLFPLKNMTRKTRPTNVVAVIRYSDSESYLKEVNSVFTNPPPPAGYEPPLHLYSNHYPIFKVDGSNFLLPAKKH